MVRRFALAAACAGLCLAQSPQAGRSRSQPEVEIAHRPYLPSLHFSAQGSLVEVPVIVLDHDGNPLAGLPASAFHVYDNGREQALVSFKAIANPNRRANAPTAAPPTALPTSASEPAPAAPGSEPAAIGLFFDDLHIPNDDVLRLRQGAERYLVSTSGPQERVGIFTSSGEDQLDFGATPQAATAALAKLRSRMRMSPSGMQACPRITPEEAYQILNVPYGSAYATAVAEGTQCDCIDQNNTSLDCRQAEPVHVRAAAQATWDQAQQQSQLTLEAIGRALDVVSAQPGRRTLIVASSGYLDATLYALESALVQRAVRDGVVIDSLDAKGLVASDIKESELLSGEFRTVDPANVGTQPPYDQAHVQELIDVTQGMAMLANATGGKLFWNKNDLAGGFASLTAPPAVSYELEFSPQPNLTDGAWHALRISVDDPRVLAIQARHGYFAASAADARAAILDSEALGSDVRRDLGVTSSASLQAGAHQVEVDVDLDVKTLSFVRNADRNDTTLTFISVLRSAPAGGVGAPIAGRESVMRLHLTDATLAKWRAEGIHTSESLSFPAGAGPFEIREVIIDGNSGRLCALNILVHR